MDGGDSDPVAWLDLRASIVEGIRSGLLSGREVMEELGVSSGTLGGWCRAEDVRRGRGRPSPRSPSWSGRPPFVTASWSFSGAGVACESRPTSTRASSRASCGRSSRADAPALGADLRRAGGDRHPQGDRRAVRARARPGGRGSLLGAPLRLRQPTPRCGQDPGVEPLGVLETYDRVLMSRTTRAGRNSSTGSTRCSADRSRCARGTDAAATAAGSLVFQTEDARCCLTGCSTQPRAQASGRKNWLFAGSLEAGRRAA
jgi:hypothetical protein